MKSGNAVFLPRMLGSTGKAAISASKQASITNRDENFERPCWNSLTAERICHTMLVKYARIPRPV